MNLVKKLQKATRSGGETEFAEGLLREAVKEGVRGVFEERGDHPDDPTVESGGGDDS